MMRQATRAAAQRHEDVGQEAQPVGLERVGGERQERDRADGGPDHREADGVGGHLPAADEVVVGRAVLAAEVEPDRQHRDEVDRDGDPVVEVELHRGGHEARQDLADRAAQHGVGERVHLGRVAVHDHDARAGALRDGHHRRDRVDAEGRADREQEVAGEGRLLGALEIPGDEPLAEGDRRRLEDAAAAAAGGIGLRRHARARGRARSAPARRSRDTRPRAACRGSRRPAPDPSRRPDGGRRRSGSRAYRGDRRARGRPGRGGPHWARVDSRRSRGATATSAPARRDRRRSTAASPSSPPRDRGSRGPSARGNPGSPNPSRCRPRSGPRRSAPLRSNAARGRSAAVDSPGPKSRSLNAELPNSRCRPTRRDGRASGPGRGRGPLARPRGAHARDR